MIRITSKNGELEEWESNSFDYGKALNKRATKIEKQVKDLTIEECKKLGLCGVDLYKGGVWFDEPMKEHIDYYDDDYIDITDLVKEQENE